MTPEVKTRHGVERWSRHLRRKLGKKLRIVNAIAGFDAASELPGRPIRDNGWVNREDHSAPQVNE